jgi:anaerobic magnesium-protoporphyrin IX monomethyl ester cyclase
MPTQTNFKSQEPQFDEKYKNSASQLDQELSRFIENPADTPDGTEFNRLALKLFHFQYTYNRHFRKYCQLRSATPDAVKSWKEVPAVPTVAFKEVEIRSFPAEDQVHFLVTSGTSEGKPGRILHNQLGQKFWNLTNKMSARRFLYPSGKPLHALLAVPPLNLAPHLGIGNAIPNFVFDTSSSGPEWFMDSTGLKSQELLTRLERCMSEGEPILMIGATFCFVHFMDFLKEKGKKFKLPAGSVVADGGGFKGKSREIAKNEYQSMIMDYFGLPETHIINMLGMTELNGVFFENVLRNYHEKRPLHRCKEGTPWTRTLIVDPDTLEELPKGEVGLLKHYSLGNIHTVMGILTDDVGVAVESGFEVIGRASRTESRGCSIFLDEFISKNGVK